MPVRQQTMSMISIKVMKADGSVLLVRVLLNRAIVPFGCHFLFSFVKRLVHPCLTDPRQVGILRGDGCRRSKFAWDRYQGEMLREEGD